MGDRWRESEDEQGRARQSRAGSSNSTTKQYRVETRSKRRRTRCCTHSIDQFHLNWRLPHQRHSSSVFEHLRGLQAPVIESLPLPHLTASTPLHQLAIPYNHSSHQTHPFEPVLQVPPLALPTFSIDTHSHSVQPHIHTSDSIVTLCLIIHSRILLPLPAFCHSVRCLISAALPVLA